jgi:hypothetical protein
MDLSFFVETGSRDLLVCFVFRFCPMSLSLALHTGNVSKAFCCGNTQICVKLKAFCDVKARVCVCVCVCVCV